MKKLQLLSYLFAALFMVTMVSCNDDDDNDNVTPDREGLLVGKTWRGDKIFVNGVDLTATKPGGVDVTTINIVFKADGTFTGTLVDDDNSNDTDSGRWTLSSDGTKLTLTDDDDNSSDDDDDIILTVNRLTATELWLEGDFSGTGQAIEFRFVKE
ncbi:lipocalin family protein [Pontibacter burrus]|uniref:Lipocalin-like domain-containing protein n=1 Tax=Pontibacter burrus TaxID=2704466 RepID=A0A6B3LNA5_9BACT|nr:lipocalin family protein [Pontibacter burrus]NEM97373.1 hypothetical protein [Pontibacter burrus]